jgi:hypothetical protein
MSRSRLQVFALALDGQAETIAIDYLLPYNCTLIQFSVTFGSIPLAAPFRALTIIRQNSLSALFNTVIRSFVPAEVGATSIVCTETAEFMKSDHVLVDYDNIDDHDVGLELIFKEGGD